MTTIRKNITQPADWWAAFEAQAKRDKLTLSEWVGKQCRKGLKVKLSERPRAHRPKSVTRS